MVLLTMYLKNNQEGWMKALHEARKSELSDWPIYCGSPGENIIRYNGQKPLYYAYI
jgi:hypothetical protein